LLAQAPYLSLLKLRMAYSQDEKSIIESNIGFFELGVLLEIVTKPFKPHD
jgi:hypothetical protein